MEISFDRRNVSECLQQRFTLPTYQREYKWELKHLQELMSDIQDEFLEKYDVKHGRQEVAAYAPYFLGTIITTSGPAGKKVIVDGQQRITTLVMLLSYFNRLNKKDDKVGLSDIASLLQKNVFGKIEFNLDFEPARSKLFNILSGIEMVSDSELLSSVESIPDLDDGSRRIFDLYQKIETFLNSEVSKGLLPHFVDYLTQRVYLFEIGVPGEQDGHKVFVTMNDRGLKLSPIDLLKGYLLSNIGNPAQNTSAHEKWNECIAKLRALGPDEDSLFFKTWLRAQYAKISRGKSRGAAPADFELIGDGYHRWVMDHRAALGLNNSDDFYNLVSKVIPHYISYYIRIKNSESLYNIDYPHVFYNGARDLTLQSMMVLAAIGNNDSSAEADRKIKMVSFFLDYLSVSRIVNGKDNTYDNVKEIIFTYTKQVRDKDSSSLSEVLVSLMKSIELIPDTLVTCGYDDLKRQDMLHVLSRIADHLEGLVDQSNAVGFPSYVDRTKGNRTFDVEHLLPASWAGSDRDKQKIRNNIGSLILLPRGRNRSLRDASYSAKLSKYASENVLGQTLVKDYYDNNPSLAPMIAIYSVSHIDIFDEAGNIKRKALYRDVASNIWSSKVVEEIADSKK